jgi:hypothetical protein
VTPSEANQAEAEPAIAAGWLGSISLKFGVAWLGRLVISILAAFDAFNVAILKEGSTELAVT